MYINEKIRSFFIRIVEYISKSFQSMFKYLFSRNEGEDIKLEDVEKTTVEDTKLEYVEKTPVETVRELIKNLREERKSEFLNWLKRKGKGVDINSNINDKNNDGNTLLHLLCKSLDNLDIIKLLLKNKVNTVAQNNKGQTALHILLCRFPYGNGMGFSGNSGMIKLFKFHLSFLRAVEQEHEDSFFNIKIITELLIAKDINITNIKDREGKKPIDSLRDAIEKRISYASTNPTATALSYDQTVAVLLRNDTSTKQDYLEILDRYFKFYVDIIDSVYSLVELDNQGMEHLINSRNCIDEFLLNSLYLNCYRLDIINCNNEMLLLLKTKIEYIEDQAYKDKLLVQFDNLEKYLTEEFPELKQIIYLSSKAGVNDSLNLSKYINNLRTRIDEKLNNYSLNLSKHTNKLRPMRTRIDDKLNTDSMLSMLSIEIIVDRCLHNYNEKLLQKKMLDSIFKECAGAADIIQHFTSIGCFDKSVQKSLLNVALSFANEKNEARLPLPNSSMVQVTTEATKYVKITNPFVV